MSEVCVRVCVFERAGVRTSDGSADFRGGGLPHLQRRLLAVPGCVWCADQVGSIFERTLGKTRGKSQKRGFPLFLKLRLCGQLNEKETFSEKPPERLRLMDVQSCSSYPAFFQGLSQSFLIYQTAPRRVDQEGTLTHLNTHTHGHMKNKYYKRQGVFLKTRQRRRQ